LPASERRCSAFEALLVKITLMAFAVACAVASADRRAEADQHLVDQLRERILAQLELRPGMAVAEIGVGGGWFVVHVAEAVGPDGIVYGTDIDPEVIASLRRRLQTDPAARNVDLRLCRDPRDTALDDLPDGRVDLILMVDSLCFDAHQPRQSNVAYLRRFLRVLRPGGRLVHHMDCRCDVSPDAVVAQFTDAGFSPRVEVADASPDPALVGPDWPCRTDAERQRHGFVAVFRKPDTALGDGAAGGSAGP
jgi:predicted methyltransferase